MKTPDSQPMSEWNVAVGASEKIATRRAEILRRLGFAAPSFILSGLLFFLAADIGVADFLMARVDMVLGQLQTPPPPPHLSVEGWIETATLGIMALGIAGLGVVSLREGIQEMTHSRWE